jgi:YfiH family protein
MSLEYLQLADWPESVTAAITTRAVGHSEGPWGAFNLADHVGDDPAHVAANRDILSTSWPHEVTFNWLSQVHGVAVVEADRDAGVPQADALWTDRQGLACAVLVADCLPVLLCSEDGRCVAAAHAGWRGLAGGILERTVDALPVPAASLLAWLGPCIGPCHFRIGDAVADRLRGDLAALADSSFSPIAGEPGFQLADLRGLAALRLQRLGVARITRDERCSYCDAERFFSYRRDGQTGRMAALISLNSPLLSP